MSRNRYVEGNINEFTGGSHKIFSEEKIITNSHSTISQKGEENGVSFNEPQKIAAKLNDDFYLAADLAWLSMVVIYDDDIPSIGATFKRDDNSYTFTIIGIEMNKTYGFRCYNFAFRMRGLDYNAIVFVGTRDKNFFSVTDNLSQAFRISEQVGWSKEIGIKARYYSHVIFAGHSKGGREAAQAAIEHGSAPVYSYNTSIAYLDNQRKVREYIASGAYMIHFTVPGELLLVLGVNGENAGFKAKILNVDDVKVRPIKFRIGNRHHPKSTEIRYVYAHENGNVVELSEQISRHTDFGLMMKGLYNQKGYYVSLQRLLIYSAIA